MSELAIRDTCGFAGVIRGQKSGASTVASLVHKHILGEPALRPYALPGGRHIMVLIHGCRCSERERRGPDGGVCGACGGAIPGKGAGE